MSDTRVRKTARRRQLIDQGGKLTPQAVKSIRARASAGEAYKAIAHDWGISVPMVCHIKTGQRWAWVL